jgi:hypothetical protein
MGFIIAYFILALYLQLLCLVGFVLGVVDIILLATIRKKLITERVGEFIEKYLWKPFAITWLVMTGLLLIFNFMCWVLDYHYFIK